MAGSWDGSLTWKDYVDQQLMISIINWWFFFFCDCFTLEKWDGMTSLTKKICCLGLLCGWRSWSNSKGWRHTLIVRLKQERSTVDLGGYRPSVHVGAKTRTIRNFFLNITFLGNWILYDSKRQLIRKDVR